MGRHSSGDSGSFWKSLTLFGLKWVGIAVLPILVVVGVANLLLSEEPASNPTVEPSPTEEPSPSPTVEPTPTPSPSPSPEPPPGPLDVLNGTPRAGLAASAAEELREAGYQIGEIGNAARRYQQTTVFHQEGQEQLANEVAAFIGASVVSPAPEEGVRSEVPVTVVLGDDFRP